MENGRITLDKNFKKYKKEDVMQHVSPEDCWVIVKGSVYNVTKFLENHPGGPNLILAQGGSDITNLLNNGSVHQHSLSAYYLLEQYKIGYIEGEDDEV